MTHGHLAAVPEGASDEEVAAIVAALTVLDQERQAGLSTGVADIDDGLDSWVRASRLTARRSGLVRGPWRLAGRIGRRSRA